jgi:hypothetical protein
MVPTRASRELGRDREGKEGKRKGKKVLSTGITAECHLGQVSMVRQGSHSNSCCIKKSLGLVS